MVTALQQLERCCCCCWLRWRCGVSAAAAAAAAARLNGIAAVLAVRHSTPSPTDSCYTTYVRDALWPTASSHATAQSDTATSSIEPHSLTLSPHTEHRAARAPPRQQRATASVNSSQYQPSPWASVPAAAKLDKKQQHHCCWLLVASTDGVSAPTGLASSVNC